MAIKKSSKKTKTTRTSAKEQLTLALNSLRDYKHRALGHISNLKYPHAVNHLSITGYELREGRKFSKSLPVPELITMVGMAEQFGKKVNVTVTGKGDETTLNFNIIEIPNIPIDLL